MSSLSIWLRLCCLLKLISEFNSYVLFAANADDFHNIAKKIVPETLANKLAELASDTYVKRKARGKRDNEPEYYSESEEDDDVYNSENEYSDYDETNSTESKEHLYVKEWKTKVNFDELVERVKDRLAKELSEKLKGHVLNAPTGVNTQSIYNNVEPNTDQKTTIKKSPSIDTDIGFNQNSVKLKKTYGYSSKSKGKSYSDDHKNTNRFPNIDYQDQDTKDYTQQHLNPTQKHEKLYNSKNINQNLKINQERYKMESSNNYETPNVHFDNTNDNANGKHRYEFNHEEDNGSYHSKIYKKLNYERGVSDFNKKDIKYGESPEYSQQNDKINEFKQDEPVRYVYKDSLSQQPNIDQIIASTDRGNEQSLFNEYDLTSNRKSDSYEDYIIPMKANIFASEETNKPMNTKRPKKIKKSLFPKNNKSQFKVRDRGVLKKTKPLKNERQKVLHDEIPNISEDYVETTEKSMEVKAKTESLLYNYDDAGPKTIKDDSSEHIETPYIKKRKPKGTMIPTREYFKMASPNYYISLPTVAEKYDPNEPLPEKDREREVIKHFANPPASINKKVKLV